MPSCLFVLWNDNQIRAVQVWPVALAIAQFSGPESLQVVLRQMFDCALARGSAMHVFALLATQSFDGVSRCLQQESTSAESSPRIMETSGCQALPPEGPQVSDTPLPSQPWDVLGFPDSAPTVPNMTSPQAAGITCQQEATLRQHLQGQHLHPGSTGFHFTWRKSLVMLVANRSVGDMPALAALGDALWAAKVPSSKQYAHVCYVLAGKLLGSAANPGCSFVAPGIDHVTALGACGSTDALQRSELLAWCQMQCYGISMYNIIPSYIMVRSNELLQPARASKLMLSLAAVTHLGL